MGILILDDLAYIDDFDQDDSLEMSKAEFQDLREAAEESFNNLRDFRDQREKFLKEYVGGHYGSHERTVPNNLIYRYVSILKRALTPGNPRAKVDTFNAELKPYANSFEQALNFQIKDMKLNRPLKLAIIEALVGVGVVKVGLNDSGFVEIGGIYHDVMEPYAEVVQFENMVWDTTAETLEQCSFIGNRYPMTIEDIEDAGIYDLDEIEELKRRGSGNLYEDGEFHANEFTSGQRGHQNVHKKKVLLWDLWLPREDALITFVDGTNIILRSVPWEGPECGPYHFLRFDLVPGNIMPVPPVSQLFDLHRIENAIMVKSANQARRQKTITTVAGGSENDAVRITKAGDGEAVKVQNGAGVNEVSMGGVTPGNLQVAGAFDQMFSKNAGNLDVLGGLDSQAATLGQEKLLDANSSKQITSMGDEVQEFVAEIIESIGYYIWEDPLTNIPIRKTVEGVPGIEILGRFDENSKKGYFDDYALDIYPYSLEGRSPAEEAQVIMQLVTQVYLPLIDMAQQQGIALDVAALLTKLGDDMNLPGLSEVLVAQGIPLTNKQQTPGRDRPKQAAHTVREHVRHNATPRQKEDPMMAIAKAMEGADAS